MLNSLKFRSILFSSTLFCNYNEHPLVPSIIHSIMSTTIISNAILPYHNILICINFCQFALRHLAKNDNKMNTHMCIYCVIY